MGKGHGGTPPSHRSLVWALPSGMPARPGPGKALLPHRWHGRPLRDKGALGLSGFPGGR